jgi:hypothetical protein
MESFSIELRFSYKQQQAKNSKQRNTMAHKSPVASLNEVRATCTVPKCTELYLHSVLAEKPTTQQALAEELFGKASKLATTVAGIPAAIAAIMAAQAAKREEQRLKREKALQKAKTEAAEAAQKAITDALNRRRQMRRAAAQMALDQIQETFLDPLQYFMAEKIIDGADAENALNKMENTLSRLRFLQTHGGFPSEPVYPDLDYGLHPYNEEEDGEFYDSKDQ